MHTMHSVSPVVWITVSRCIGETGEQLSRGQQAMLEGSAAELQEERAGCAGRTNAVQDFHAVLHVAVHQLTDTLPISFTPLHLLADAWQMSTN